NTVTPCDSAPTPACPACSACPAAAGPGCRTSASRTNTTGAGKWIGMGGIQVTRSGHPGLPLLTSGPCPVSGCCQAPRPMIAAMKTTISSKALLPLMLGIALATLLATPAALADDDDHIEARRLLQRGEIL